MQNKPIISFHSNAPYKGVSGYYRKGKFYTEEEYWEMRRRKQKIKDTIFNVIHMSLFITFMICRAYVFLEYGI